MTVKVKLLNENAKLPTYGSEKAACCDLYAAETAVILPRTMQKVGTGLSFAPPVGYYGAVYARSGMATKKGLRPANCVGICDEDYRSEYIVALYNDSDCIQRVEVGDRIAQIVFVPYEQTVFEVCDELDDTARGAGGFGSTGVN